VLHGVGVAEGFGQGPLVSKRPVKRLLGPLRILLALKPAFYHPALRFFVVSQRAEVIRVLAVQLPRLLPLGVAGQVLRPANDDVNVRLRAGLRLALGHVAHLHRPVLVVGRALVLHLGEVHEVRPSMPFPKLAAYCSIVARM
jgi:hypothetical protein